MHFQQLAKTYRDDTIADAMYAREVEFFHYDFDRANYVAMLKTLPAGAFRALIQQRLDETLEQIGNVSAIHAALLSQVTDQRAHAAAIKRTAAKRRTPWLRRLLGPSK